jgi:hypothetical protein
MDGDVLVQNSQENHAPHEYDPLHSYLAIDINQRDCRRAEVKERFKITPLYSPINSFRSLAADRTARALSYHNVGIDHKAESL